jgi:hypothetical protein
MVPINANSDITSRGRRRLSTPHVSIIERSIILNLFSESAHACQTISVSFSATSCLAEGVVDFASHSVVAIIKHKRQLVKHLYPPYRSTASGHRSCPIYSIYHLFSRSFFQSHFDKRLHAVLYRRVRPRHYISLR